MQTLLEWVMEKVATTVLIVIITLDEFTLTNNNLICPFLAVGGGQYTGQIKGQNYADLKRSCLKSGTLFVDDLFVPKELNISAKNIKWVRASELVRNPKFMPDDLSVCDIEQGRLSDCWFISAMAVLTLKPALLKKVVPQQSFQDGYAG